MTQKRDLRLSLMIVAAVLASTCPVAAGPIGWSYAVSAAPAADYDGKLQLVITPNQGPYHYQSGRSVEAQLLAAFVDRTPPPGQSDIMTEYRYDVQVRIGDEASGQSGDVAFQGYLKTFWKFYPDVTDPVAGTRGPRMLVDHQEINFGPPGHSALLFLGEHRYRFETYLSTNGFDTEGYMKVTAWHISETPEPGTLALAGLGLAAVGAARVRRRGLVTPPGSAT